MGLQDLLDARNDPEVFASACARDPVACEEAQRLRDEYVARATLESRWAFEGSEAHFLIALSAANELLHATKLLPRSMREARWLRQVRASGVSDREFRDIVGWWLGKRAREAESSA